MHNSSALVYKLRCSSLFIVLLFIHSSLVSSVNQGCVTNGNCPMNSYCASNNKCVCNLNHINYACDIVASQAQSPPNFTILSSSSSYFYIQPTDSETNNYVYYTIKICSVNATAYPTRLSVNSYANLGTNNFLTDGPLSSINITFSNQSDCVNLQTPMIMFGYQPNGSPQQLVFALIDVTSGSGPTQNTIYIDTQLQQVVQSNVLRIVGYVLTGVCSAALLFGIISYCKRRRECRRENQMNLTEKKTVRLSPEERIMHFDKFMQQTTYEEYQKKKNNQIINAENPVLNSLNNSNFSDKLIKIQKRAIQMTILDENNKKSFTILNQNDQNSKNMSKNMSKNQLKKIQCCVCLNQIVKADVIRETICHHIFHKQCIDQWCKRAQGINCPMCRTQLDYDNVKNILSQRGQNYESQMSQYINRTGRRFQMRHSLL